MNKRRLCFLPLVLMTLCTPPSSAQEYVELRDDKGREIDATIISIFGDKVNVRLRNMRQYSIPISKLDAGSLMKIEEWKAQQILKNREPFKVNIGKYEKNEEESKSVHRAKDDDTNQNLKWSIKVENYDQGYEVTLTNTTSLRLSGLRVEYVMLKEDAVIAAKSNDDVNLKVIRGEANLTPMDIRDEATFRTKALPMTESRLRGDAKYAGGGSRTAEDDLGGIWFKVYSGDIIVFEYARPSSLQREIPWDPPKK